MKFVFLEYDGRLYRLDSQTGETWVLDRYRIGWERVTEEREEQA